MGGDDHRGSAPVVALQQGHDDAGRGGVQAAGGFVGQEDFRAAHNGARHRHALLLAAREGRGQGAVTTLEADGPQNAVNLLADQGLPLPHGLQHQGDVGENRPRRNQAVVLKDDAEPAPQVGNAFAGYPGQVQAVHQDLALGGRLPQVQELEQGGFAGAAGAGDEHQLVLEYVQGDVVQRIQRSVAPVDAEQAHDRRPFVGGRGCAPEGPVLGSRRRWGFWRHNVHARHKKLTQKPILAIPLPSSRSAVSSFP